MQSIKKFVTSLKLRLIVGTALLLLILNCTEGAILISERTWVGIQW